MSEKPKKSGVLPEWAAFQAQAEDVPGPPPRPARPVEVPRSTPDGPSRTGAVLAAVPAVVDPDPQSEQAPAAKPSDLTQSAGAAVETGPRTADSGPQQPSRPTPQPSRPLQEAGTESPSGGASRTSFRQLAQLKATREAATKLQRAFTAGGMSVEVREPHLDGTLLQALVAVPGSPDPSAMLDVLEAVAAELSIDDLDVSVEGDALRLWVQILEDNRARQAAAWVPNDLRARQRAHKEATGEPATQLLLRAFNALHENLDELFAAGPEVESNGPMSVRRTRVRKHTEPSVQLWLYLQPAERARLDDAVRTSGAGSFSDLVTVLLETYLDRLETTQAR